MKLSQQKQESIKVIVGMAVLVFMFLAGTFFIGKSPVQDNPEPSTGNGNDNYEREEPLEDYILYINDSYLGKSQTKVDPFPNIHLGIQKEHRKIVEHQGFELSSSPFSNNYYVLDLQLEDSKNVKELLIYFSPNNLKGNPRIIVKTQNTGTSSYLRSGDTPLILGGIFNTSTSILFKIERPKWYNLFTRDKAEIENLQVLANYENREEMTKTYNFDIQKEHLQQAFIELLVACDNKKTISDAIKIELNGYIIANTNPDCLTRIKKVTAKIPLNILKENRNTLEFETKGFYTFSYTINKIYLNEQKQYPFLIKDFNGLYDIIIRGDFDQEIISILINNKKINLARDNITSIIQYVRLGTNTLEFRENELYVKELYIQETNYWD